MAKPHSRKQKDVREEKEVDVDRMINEGMAGGTVSNEYGHVHLEHARDLPDQHEPFPTTEEKED